MTKVVLQWALDVLLCIFYKYTLFTFCSNLDSIKNTLFQTHILIWCQIINFCSGSIWNFPVLNVPASGLKSLPNEVKMITKSIDLKAVKRYNKKHLSVKETSALRGIPENTVDKNQLYEEHNVIIVLSTSKQMVAYSF